jgi:hypothetical protein
MGVLRDMLHIIKDVDVDSITDLSKRFNGRDYHSGTMSRRAAEGTMQFPLLASRTISFPTIQLIANACERNCASFVQIVLSMHPEMDVRNGSSGFDYLEMFHQNSDTTEDPLNTIMTTASENYVIQTRTFTVDANKLKILKEELTAHGIDWREGRLNDVVKPRYIHDNHFIRPVSHMENMERLRDKLDAIKEAEATTDQNGKPVQPVNQFNLRPKAFYSSDDAINLTTIIDKSVTKIDDRKQKTPQGGQDFIVPKDMLKDNDVKKANELVPTLLHIRVIAKDSSKESDPGQYVDFVIGVKCMIHPIGAEDMNENLVDACRNHDSIFKFIRWTTGEISFLKDFLLNMNEYRTDVARQTKGSSPWWNRLKHLKVLSGVKAAMFISKKIIPNASIVVSQEEVDVIKNQYGFNLMNPSFVRKIMKKFFLMSFIVVDDSSEVAHFMYDGQSSYQTVTYTGLERENANSARQFKEILKAVQRI